MTNDQMLLAAKATVMGYYKERGKEDITAKDVYIVWFCKTLQNWKALASTDYHDGMYFEVTYDGDKNLIYFDAYHKEVNISMEVEGNNSNELE